MELPTCRAEILKLVPKGARSVEVGVCRGRFSIAIWRAIRPKILYLVDGWDAAPEEKWATDSNRAENLRHTAHRFIRFIANGRVRLICQRSPEAAKHVRDRSLGFIYIDADHREGPCYKDLCAWYPKLAVGGIMAGHDWSNIEFKGMKFGVKDAVTRFAKERKLRKIYTTQEKTSPSWWFYGPRCKKK